MLCFGFRDIEDGVWDGAAMVCHCAELKGVRKGILDYRLTRPLCYC